MKRIMKWFDSHLPMISIVFYIVFSIVFFIINQVTTPKYIIHSIIDDYIPFNEYFIIPYMLWFVMIAFSLIYFVIHSKKDYLHLCFMMYMSMTISVLIYLMAPNGLQLRVELTNNNTCTQIVKLIQSIDNPTNVCPSIHVSVILAICASLLKSHCFSEKYAFKICVIIITILICMSTVFLKQHSIIDVFWGVVLAFIMYIFAYHTSLDNKLS